MIESDDELSRVRIQQELGRLRVRVMTQEKNLLDMAEKYTIMGRRYDAAISTLRGVMTKANEAALRSSSAAIHSASVTSQSVSVVRNLMRDGRQVEVPAILEAAKISAKSCTRSAMASNAASEASSLIGNFLERETGEEVSTEALAAKLIAEKAAENAGAASIIFEMSKFTARSM